MIQYLSWFVDELRILVEVRSGTGRQCLLDGSIDLEICWHSPTSVFGVRRLAWTAA